MTIWANTIVHNEESFIWFALMSVVDCVDKILVWDTGSTDKTVEIIKEVIKAKGEKVVFKEVGKVDDVQFTKMRQAMLVKSKCDWILVLDGDEVWWEDSIKKVAGKIQKASTRIDGVVVPMVVTVGDIYHFQEQSAGRYELLGRKGHYNLRLVNRNIPGLHADLPYGKESYFDDKKVLIQKREKVVFLDAPYLHLTHLKRSAKIRKGNKFKLEIGKQFPRSLKYPEVFYLTRPDIVPDPWQKMSPSEYALASILTPFRKLKRSLLL